MKVAKLYEILNTISPFELQAKWDKSGFNVGSMNAEYKHVYVALELDWQVLNAVECESVVIVHHPLIFRPLQSIELECYPANLIAQCLQKKIHIIAMHTNFDTTHLNAAFAERLRLEELGYQPNGEQEYSLIYSAQTPTTPQRLATHIKESLDLPQIRYTQASTHIENLYITCGSNASAYQIAKRGDCIITGDIKYHDAMIAASMGISFVDVPHFESECIFTDLMAKALQKYHIQAIISNSHNPFCSV